jgi:hypothetical protein
MPKSYSLDLRERVVRFVEEGRSRCGAFQGVGFLRGELGESSSREGSIEPKPSAGRRHAKLEPHRSFLLAQVANRTPGGACSRRAALRHEVARARDKEPVGKETASSISSVV